MNGDVERAGTIPVRWDRLVGRVLLMFVIATMAIAVAQHFRGHDPRTIPLPSWARPESEDGGARLFALIASSTFVSEDLTCIVSGMMAGRRELALPFAIAACAVGIFIGDILLFVAGRYLVRPIVRDSNRAPHRRARWKIEETEIARASTWLSRRGAFVIVLSRFIPGTRLPLYLAAGVLDTSFPRFSVWLLVAVSAWTPLLVGAAALWGNALDPAALGLRATLIGGTIALTVLLLLELRGMSRKRRRLLVSRWHRLTRWEFWPSWLFYLPVTAQIARLALRHRSLLCFTAANPAMPGGGFIGESKHAILEGLRDSAEFLPKMCFVPRGDALASRLSIVESFLATHPLAFPVVLKPDAGQRGSGVVIARTLDECRGYLEAFPGDVVAQEYIDGPELGVFYVRHPEEANGRIFAITDKRLLTLRGDGKRTLEELILDDDRAISMASFHLAQHAPRLREIPRDGEMVQLVSLGTHCRGALFLDGMHLWSRELEEAVDRVSRAYEGFYFGRYDIRGESLEAIREGRFKVLELNGVTSEATSIYDPRNRLADAYRTLFEQWRLAFEIGAANVARGHRTATPGEIVSSLRSYLAAARLHPDSAQLRRHLATAVTRVVSIDDRAISEARLPSHPETTTTTRGSATQ